MYPEEIRLAVRSLDPSCINRYLLELALKFRCLNKAGWLNAEAGEVYKARLKLAQSVKIVLADGLGILNIKCTNKRAV